ncbi:MAG TPA: alpha/beta hydrolase [Gaiellaceae bacterium]|nr:alpha/beta hydrolase [Gaiellaceae bacterium]
MRRLGIVHRWGGAPGADWYPWLRDELRALDPPPFDAIGIPELPAPDTPRPETWVPALAEWLGEDPRDRAATVLVGHSIGCQTIVRSLAEGGPPVEGCLLVAPWFWLDEDSRDETSELWATPLDDAAARAAAGKVVALLSRDDPYTSDWEANARACEARVGAEVVVEPGGGHFTGDREPKVLELVLEHFGPGTREPRSVQVTRCYKDSRVS